MGCCRSSSAGDRRTLVTLLLRGIKTASCRTVGSVSVACLISHWNLVTHLSFQVEEYEYQYEAKLARELLRSKLAEKDDGEPVAYIAWRDGQPCWDEDCVCQDAVYPVDSDDDRTSMPVYLHPAPRPMTDFDIRGKLSTLKCWHRLTGDEVQDLIEFAQKQQPE